MGEEESTKCHGLILFLTLEFCDMDLECWLEENSATSTPEQKWDIFYQTVQGIQAVHSQNIIHRDIKPQNILIKLDSDGKVNVKLADFGISRNYNTSTRSVPKSDAEPRQDERTKKSNDIPLTPTQADKIKKRNSKSTQDESVNKSKSPTTMTKVGTFAYVAPEVINSRVKIYNEKSDVWTLGAVRDEDLDSHQRVAKSIVRKLCAYFPSDRPS